MYNAYNFDPETYHSLANVTARSATLKDLREQRASLIAGNERLLDDCDKKSRELTAMEKSQFDSAMSQVESLNTTL